MKAIVNEISANSLADIGRTVSDPTVRNVAAILRAVRTHLNMDIAFVSEFVGEQRYFRHVDSKQDQTLLRVGDTRPIDEDYCLRVVQGRLPELIVDTARVPEAMGLPMTTIAPIGSHLSVPIRLKSGRVYGTFCCFSFSSDLTLTPRDLQFLRAFADIAARLIDEELEANSASKEKADRIAAALAQNQPAIVFQPMVALDGRSRVVGIECLARFDADSQAMSRRSPAFWFAEAAEVGKGPALELQAIRNGLRALASVQLADDISVWLNVSGLTLLNGGLTDHLEGFPISRIVLELTEHEHVEDYAALNQALRPLRDDGVRVAIDDAGAGYASLAHILNVAPDFIKLDLSLTRHIDVDRKRRALAAALIEFGRQSECEIVAEGVETSAELGELRHLGTQFAQGHFICEPVTGGRLAATLQMLSRDGSRASS